MKNALRKTMKKRRLTLGDEEKGRCSAQCVKQLTDLIDHLFVKSGVMAIYIPTGNEVDVTDMIVDYRRAGWTVAAPRVEGQIMHFYEIQSIDDCEKGSFGIPEPMESCRRVAGDQIDCMIVPGLAFDHYGNRLGYGGGFYDRYLTGHPRIVKIAVAYDFQVTDRLPAEDHDIKMNYLATEMRLTKM